MPRAKRLRVKYLIVGNSAGGIGAAEAIREVDKAGSITVVSDEPYPCYSRPLISKYLAKERTLEGMLFREPDFYEQNSINALLGESATVLDLKDRTVHLESGKSLEWERLLVATGGVPIIPQIDGLDKRGVFSFMTLDDAKAIDEFLDGASKAVVIGGGLIGISVTEALEKRGLDVTVVEMKENILNTILDEQGSLIAEEALKGAGIRLVTANTVASIQGKEWVTGVVLADGEEVPCNLVVVAIGVLPQVELVRDTDIKVNRGIVVDLRMATTHADVCACGDVAEAYDFIYGANRLTPIWPNAYIGGRVAGLNMAGVQAEYPGSTALNSLNYFGLDIASVGLPVPPGSDGYEVMSKLQNGAYKKLVLRDNVIVGLVCIGDIDKSGMLYGLMKDRVNVSEFKDSLLADDFGLVSLPRRLWQERLGTPPEHVYQPASEEEVFEDVVDE